MKPLDISRGSGNVFSDFGHPDAHVQQAKTVLAAEIIKAMDAKTMSARQAEAQTGIAAVDFSRIRNADLGRFTTEAIC